MISLWGPHSILRMNSMYVLWKLSKSDDYCYNLAKAFELDKTKAPSHTKIVRVYLMLQYLKTKGFVSTNGQPKDCRGKRTYSITKKGLAELKNYKKELKAFFGDYINYLSE